MKIIHFSCMDTGGAGIAAVRYNTLLREKGIDSVLYVKNKANPDPSIIKIRTQKNRSNSKSLKYKIKGIGNKLLFAFLGKSKVMYYFCNFFDTIESGLVPDLLNQIDYKDVDYVFVHWLGDFLNSYDLIKLYNATKAKFIFSMMDLEHITGGCHFPWQCTKYHTNCMDCPALPISNNLLAHDQLLTKVANYAYLNAEIFSSALYDLEFARNSIVKFKKYWQLYYPIDENIFKPNNEEQRKDVITLFANVNSVGDPRKGFNYLLAVLLSVDKKITCKVRFLCLSAKKFLAYNFEHIEFEEFPFCKNVNELVRLYQKTDVFLCASIEDSAPMMLQEALLCGVPAISFDVGVGKQFIEDGKDGYVVPRYDIKAFEEKLCEMIENPPETIRTPEEIHEHMVSICGKETVWKSMKKILHIEEV